MNTKTAPIEARHAEYLETPDGFKIRAAVFTSTVRPNIGSVILLHGRNEAIEKYDHVIADLMKRGLDVVTFDWRGQGKSSRFFEDARRGYVDDFEQYAADLDQVFSQVALPEARPPYYVLAHSTGALVALYAAPRLVNRLQRMVLTAPFLALHDSLLSTNKLHYLTSALCFLGLGNIYIGGGPAGSARVRFETNRLTTDLDRFERNKRLMDPINGLGLGGPTAAWLHACTHAMSVVFDPDHLAKIHIPTLLIGGGSDTLSSAASIEDYAARLRSGALIMVDGARHELMQESDFYRSQFFAAFDAFVPGSD